VIVFEFALAAMLCYRISFALAIEDGPFDLFAKLQNAFSQKSWIGRGLNCPLCISWWLAIPAALLLQPADWRMLVLLWGGVAGSALVLHKVINK